MSVKIQIFKIEKEISHILWLKTVGHFWILWILILLVIFDPFVSFYLTSISMKKFLLVIS